MRNLADINELNIKKIEKREIEKSMEYEDDMKALL